MSISDQKITTTHVVTIGGGTGSFQVLIALKRIDNIKISAIVSMSDNGGSTGKLRTMYGILPPGDVRNCLVALSKDVNVWVNIFRYRFDEKLEHHSLGNLILTALTQMYGSFEKALETAHQILSIKPHEVIPVTYSKVELIAIFEDGKEINGESEITKYALMTKKRIRELKLKNFDSKILPNPKAIESIMNADFIIIGPGSLYTSVLPNLIVPEIAKAIKKSKAKKIFIVNIMSDAETYRFKVSDFISAIENFFSLDYIVINSKMPHQEILKKYETESKFFVENDTSDDRVIESDLLNEKDVLRHDPEKLSRLLHLLFVKEEYRI